MTDCAAILQLDDVQKRFPTAYGSVEVLHKVNVSISEGEFVAITGPSGSGKSTFLHLAALLDLPTSGNIRFNGNDVATLEESELCQLRKEAVGMVFQNYYLLSRRSVFENVLFRFRYLDHDLSDAKRRTEEALETMGLTHIADSPARLSSGGEMQRIAIARAIALTPRLLVADEPTGNLHSAAATTVMECFQKLNRGGITVLLVTHNEALLGYCTRRLTCRDGYIEDPQA